MAQDIQGERPTSQDAERVASLRDAIVRRFEIWLDEALVDEDAPPGIAEDVLREVQGDSAAKADSQHDLYAMWSAITALIQEVKLQGRAFRDLNEALLPQKDFSEHVQTMLGAHEEALAEARRIADKACAAREQQDREIVSEAVRKARCEVFDVLLDVRDRLTRGLQTVRAHAKEAQQAFAASWWQRMFCRRRGRFQHVLESAAALEKGYSLIVERLDDALSQFGIREIKCEGQPFDPRVMNAVDVEETREVPEGTVLEVYRTGYEWDGAVLRHAEVRAARSPRCVEEISE